MAPPLLDISLSFPNEFSKQKNKRHETQITEPLPGDDFIERHKKKSKYVIETILIFTFVHFTFPYGVYLALFKAQWQTNLWAYCIAMCSGFGITAGVHRLWAHRTYKAKWPLQLILAIFETFAGQKDILEWARDHRVHHKFSETDADPHNAKRGFFFSHIGWLLVRKHPDVIRKGRTLDISDLKSDPLVRFQRKYYVVLVTLLGFTFPTLVPWYFWNENIWTSFFIVTVVRYVVTCNITFLVNSAAHIWGTKPYDKNINPSENLVVSILTSGEGWHNYHHVFPWDYKTSEFGNYRTNLTSAFIDFFALFGWAYDLKTTSEEMIRRRVNRTGDGSHIFSNSLATENNGASHEGDLWGWGDQDMSVEEIKEVKVFNKIE